MRNRVAIALILLPVLVSGCGNTPIQWADPKVVDRAIAHAEADARRASLLHSRPQGAYASSRASLEQ